MANSKLTQFPLPGNSEPYADKYFLRTKRVLQAEGINPWVRAQVMIRKGPGKVYGIDEALAILEKYSPLVEHGGRVYALREGAEYQPRETLMLIEAPIQDIVELETMYLGVLAAETTKANEGQGIDLRKVKERMARVVKAAEGRHVSYFGARHWRFDEDAAISKAAFEAGASSCSTDIGAATIGKEGIGTTPHVLENIMAWKYGFERAVPETMKAFNRHISPEVKRIILCDYRNREITDTIETAREVPSLYGPRIDTCGENLGEGALATNNPQQLEQLVRNQIQIPTEDEKFWFGNGVTVTGVYALTKALKEKGLRLENWLSSGFAEPRKVEAFVRAEQLLKTKLFEGLGVGQIFESRASKMDIVAVGETPETFRPISKKGRQYNPNARLEIRLGGAI